MSMLKRLGVGLVSSLLITMATCWIVLAALQSTIGTADKTKTLLNNSGAYQAVIPDKLVEAGQNNSELSELLSNSQIQKLFAGSLSGQKVAEQGDRAVDGVYDWLEGNTESPQVKISVTPDESTIGESVNTYVNDLPVCAAGENPGANITTDPLSIRCIPNGISPSVITNYLKAAVASNPALANGVQVDENDLLTNGNQTIDDAYNWAPAAYQGAQALPVITAVIGLVCIGLLLVLLKLRAGLKAVGVQLVTIGAVLAIGSALIAGALKTVLNNVIPGSETVNIANALTKLTTEFSDAYRGNIIKFGLYVALLGAILWIISFILGRRARGAVTKPPQAQDTNAFNRQINS